MAKKTDPFDKFREATLGGGNTLGAALSGNDTQVRESTVPSPEAAKPKKSKNADRTLKSFHVDNQLFRKLGQVKYETGRSYDELYNEAIKDLLEKYGKL